MTQTKSEWLLEQIGSRLGVPKPAEGVILSPEPADARADLLALLADPKAAKDRLDQLADKTAKAREAVAAAKQARADHDAAVAAIVDAQAAHEKRLSDEKFKHDREMERRARDVEGREKAVADHERELANAQAKLEKDRAALDKKREAIRQAAA